MFRSTSFESVMWRAPARSSKKWVTANLESKVRVALDRLERRHSVSQLERVGVRCPPC